MNLTAWLIGDHAESILNDLTAPGGYPPAQVWIPLDCEVQNTSSQLPRYRSAWAQRTTDGERWVDFAVPADVIKEAIGPHALAFPRTLTRGKALLSNVQTRDGALMVKVPRYFRTIATEWTYEHAGQDPLITRRGRETNWATLGDLDLKASFREADGKPGLIIDRAGPRLLSRDASGYANVSGTRPASRVMSEIRTMPSDTPIRSAWCAG